jgi:chromosome segregation ATPase
VSKIEEIDKLDRAIKDAEIKLKSIENNIEQIDKEISVLTPRKSDLEKNIEFHKKATTIPIAHEYKKAKTELNRIKVRLVTITSERNKSYQACKQIEQIIEKFKKDHLDLLKISENNVLRVLFGNKNGKK